MSLCFVLLFCLLDVGQLKQFRVKPGQKKIELEYEIEDGHMDIEKANNYDTE